MADYLVKTLGKKSWLWFKNTNNYLQLENDVFQVFEKLQQQKPIEEVVQWCKTEFKLSEDEARSTVHSIHSLTDEQLNEKSSESQTNKTAPDSIVPDSFFNSKSYRFAGVDFCFFYGNAFIENMFHPLFAHLETARQNPEAHQLKLFIKKNHFYLNLNGETLGLWTNKEDHIFKGQVFMALLNKAYGKTEKDWIGVLHASAIGDDKNALLFLGDSGNGKSTASAIALANGFSLLADDFVPIDTKGFVLGFPAAISVKKQAFEILSKRFPELLKAKEYEIKAMNKTVRYLPPQLSEIAPRPIKALVFIQYTSEIDFEINPMDKHLAFQHLVTDAWLSPEKENVRFFLDWMANIPAYKMRYNNNTKMLESIRKILNDE